MDLVPGLYEALLTRDRAGALRELVGLLPTIEPLRRDGAPHFLARHIYELLLKALRSQAGETDEARVAAQVDLAGRVIELIAAASAENGVDEGDLVDAAGSVLLALEQGAQGLGTRSGPRRPTLPLRHSDLIVNGPRDLRVGLEIQREIESADQIDLLVSFLKHSGVRTVRRELAAFTLRAPGKLRVLTTTYMGATELEALEALEELGAEIRVSYDDRRTRLHAKAWLFHRASGFSTGLIGSSNLSHSALLTGCEWNVRLSAVDNAAILAKFQTTFEQYWEEGEFEGYQRERFLESRQQRRDPARDALATALRLQAYPHQQEVLDALTLEREAGHMRNLVVAATGTGKTVIAALDFARLHREWRGARLLFVAHRQEILQQSLACYRAAMSDGHFGELLVGRHRPLVGDHVFASIQALHPARLEQIDPAHYDVVVVDEFHHAEAASYKRLLEYLRPKVLLGLTATPERTDGQSILGWFEGRIAKETRLWDALELGLLAPFQYFGINDGTDLSLVDWRAGRYDPGSLERIYTDDEVRARAVLRAVQEKVRSVGDMRALGFCVSIKHARFMADYCTRQGIRALAVVGETPTQERAEAIRLLRRGEVNALFTVDLFNEGVDIPAVDTVLLLRPTESATVFLQQLGRGLRLAEGKECLTVLDFIGKAHRKFRFDLRFRSILGGSRAAVKRAIEQEFPSLPAGCEIQLDQESQRTVLENLRVAIGSTDKGLAEDLADAGDVSLRDFLDHAEVELRDVYRGPKHTFTALRGRAGFREGPAPDSAFSRSICRLLHVDDPARLQAWSQWLRAARPPRSDAQDSFQLMLMAALGQVRRPIAELPQILSELWGEGEVREEIAQVLELLSDQRRLVTRPLPDLPFQVHATYSRDEISAGLAQLRKGKLLRTQGGVYKDEQARADVLYVTLQKSEKEFTPTTLYNDYPISPSLFHWESQSVTRADSETGRRYQEHAARDWRIFLFVRESKSDERRLTRPYLFLGTARYRGHEGEKPMRITWELDQAMPPAFYSRVKVAAG